MKTNSEILCPNCKKWTVWKNLPGDTCSHCGFDFLAEKVQKEKIRKEKFYEKPVGLITINGNEHPLLKAIYKVVNFIYLIFLAITTAIVWVITTVAA